MIVEVKVKYFFSSKVFIPTFSEENVEFIIYSKTFNKQFKL